MNEKKFLSPTQINMFLRCPNQYYYRYIENLKKPPSGAMLQSTVWHKTLENNYTQKIDNHVDLPLNDMQEIYASNFDIAFQDEEVVFDDGENAGKLKDQGIEITTVHHRIIAPRVQPVEIEKTFTISLGEDFPYELMGIIDLVDDTGTIIDNKACGRTPNQADIDKDLQLSCYALGYRVENKKPEAGLRIDAIIKTKQVKAVQIKTQRNNQDCRWLLSLIENVATAIQTGIFYPNPQGWHCSQKFCGYWDLCKKL